MTLQEKSEWETKTGERPLPSPACLHSSVPAASLQSEQTRTPTRQWQSCCCHYAQSRKETQRSPGFQMWFSDHAAAGSPGESLNMPITRLEHSSGVQHWPNTCEVLSSIPSMGRDEGEHPTPIPKDLSQLMMCLYSTAGKSLRFRPNIKVESARFLSPRDLKHWSGHGQTGHA